MAPPPRSSSEAVPETDPGYRPVRAPRGTSISCRGWPQEAALRMLMNSLDAEVAERPQELIVCGGTGKAARNWRCYHAMVRALQDLKQDETLLVQSGKAAGVFQTHEWAPRVLIANSNLVGEGSNWENFHELERLGLLMYGQMSAGSWISIGPQGILETTYETLAAAGRRHFGGDLSGKWVAAGGMGGMGGAQALAATLNGAAFLGMDADGEKIKRRIRAGYCDICVNNLDEAIRLLKNAVRKKQAVAVGLIGNCAEILPELARRGIVPDLLTDQTGAHDPLNGYLPAGLSLREATELRRQDPDDYLKRAYESISRHVTAMLELQKLGAVTFEFGNHLRAVAAAQGGVKNAGEIPGFVAEFLRPLFLEGRAPFRWVALSGERADIDRADKLALELFPEDETLNRWIRLARDRVKFQGLPARACWLSYGQGALVGARMNDLVARGELKAPVVLGRHHFDGGSIASPSSATENMRDGSDAIADWPILNALLNTASGASWVSLDSGGGAGIESSMHSSQAIVADGTPEAARRIERVLANDPGMGIARYADAGYPEALALARKSGVNIPAQDE
jgi:urocanate hydratase